MEMNEFLIVVNILLDKFTLHRQASVDQVSRGARYRNEP